MSALEPIPFSLKGPKRSSIGFLGIEDIKSKIAGLLHFEENTLVVEWQEREKRDQFGFTGIGTEYETFPPEVVDIPAEWIAEVTVRSFFFTSWVRFRTRRLDALEGIPGVIGGVLTVKVTGSARRAIAPMIAAIEEARRGLPYQAPSATRQLPAGDPE